MRTDTEADILQKDFTEFYIFLNDKTPFFATSICLKEI